MLKKKRSKAEKASQVGNRGGGRRCLPGVGLGENRDGGGYLCLSQQGVGVGGGGEWGA